MSRLLTDLLSRLLPVVALLVLAPPSTASAAPLNLPITARAGGPSGKPGDGLWMRAIQAQANWGATSVAMDNVEAAFKGQGPAVIVNDQIGVAGPIDFMDDKKGYFSVNTPMPFSKKANPPGTGSHIALRMVGYIEIPSAGVVSFAIGSDDGMVLRIGGQLVFEHRAPRLLRHDVRPVNFQAPGVYAIEIFFYENEQVSAIEFSWAIGVSLERRDDAQPLPPSFALVPLAALHQTAPPAPDGGVPDLGPQPDLGPDLGGPQLDGPQLDQGAPDAGAVDQGVEVGPGDDSGLHDAGPADGGPTDAGPADAGPADAKLADSKGAADGPRQDQGQIARDASLSDAEGGAVVQGGGIECRVSDTRPDLTGGVLLLLLFLGLRCRRSRPPATIVALLAGLWSTLGSPPSARGEEGFDVERFLAAQDGAGALALPSARPPSPGSWSLMLASSYAEQPLEIESAGGERAVVKRRVSIDLGATVALVSWLQLGGSLRMAGHLALEDESAAGVSDAYAWTRLYLVDRDGLALAGELAVSIPLGDAAELRGEGAITLTPRALLSYDYGRWRGLAVFGARLRSPRTLVGEDISQELVGGLGVTARLTRLIRASVEVLGATQLSGSLAGSWRGTPLEALAGMRARLSRGLWLSVGGGLGLTQGLGAPRFRFVLGLSYRSSTADSDGDGVPDRLDRCINDPEDVDGHADEDGCPDPDNDGDGVPDTVDRCPQQPEDRDGYLDNDGCPDPDNDGDGVADSYDRCPMVYGPAAQHGCPIPRIVRRVAAAKRCAPRTKRAAPLQLTTVYFATDRATLTAQGRAKLELVARRHRDLCPLIIDGHTDARGGDRYNLGLSLLRADTVRRALIAAGMRARCLVISGFGKKRPAATNANSGGRQLNRRVQLRLGTVAQPTSAPSSAPQRLRRTP